MSVQEPIVYECTRHFGVGVVIVSYSWESETTCGIGKDEDADVKKLYAIRLICREGDVRIPFAW